MIERTVGESSAIAASCGRPEGNVDAVKSLRVLTWNSSRTSVNPLLFQAPRSDEMRSADDNMAAARAEVMRWRPDVVSLQECSSAKYAHAFGPHYESMGAVGSHCGCVHLYVRMRIGLKASRLRVPYPAVACKLDIGELRDNIVAAHLAPGASQAEKRKSQFKSICDVGSAGEAFVVMGSLNVRDDEADALAKFGFSDAAYNGKT